MSPLRTTAIAVLTGALLLPAPATSADMASTGPTRVISDCVHPKVEPRRVIAACGDSNAWAVVKGYGSWGRKQAWGNGRIHMNDCDPTCAEGTVRSYKATFRFHRVVETEDFGKLFTRLGVTYLKGGEEENVEFTLPKRPITTG